MKVFKSRCLVWICKDNPCLCTSGMVGQIVLPIWNQPISKLELGGTNGAT